LPPDVDDAVFLAQRSPRFISGGSSGIGAELVHQFAAQGPTVAFCGTRANGADELIDEIKAAGQPEPIHAACDGRDVNNAGRDDRHAMEEVTPEFWDDRLALNLKRSSRGSRCSWPPTTATV
jgi:D-xylose 1-dehydrogenase